MRVRAAAAWDVEEGDSRGHPASTIVLSLPQYAGDIDLNQSGKRPVCRRRASPTKMHQHAGLVNELSEPRKLSMFLGLAVFPFQKIGIQLCRLFLG
jgi:hypothetical protein